MNLQKPNLLIEGLSDMQVTSYKRIRSTFIRNVMKDALRGTVIFVSVLIGVLASLI